MPKVKKIHRIKSRRMAKQVQASCKRTKNTSMTKEQRKETEEEDEDGPSSFQKPAFCFLEDLEDDSDELDMTIPPTSGMEYLRRVHHEAKLCPPVVVANMDTSIFKGKQTVKFSTSSGCIPAPSSFIPCVKWQEQQVQYFIKVRKRLSAFKASLASRKEVLKPPMKLPSSKDNVGWCKLCFGTKAIASLPSKKEKSTSAVSSTDTDIATVEESGNVEGVLPLLSIICSLSQPALEKILNYHISWMEVMGLTNQQGRWFYALLASLETPLTPETCSSLRTLARNCSALRATLPNDKDPRLIPINLLICLVARFFRQADLADNPM